MSHHSHRLSPRLILYGLAATLGAIAAAAEPATRPARGESNDTAASAEVVYVQIQRPVPQPVQRLLANRRTAAPDRGASINLGLLVRVPGRRVVAATDESLQVSAFIDDKNTDLGDGKRDPNRPNYGYSPSGQSVVGEDGHACLFWITSDRVPAADAGRIFLRGTVMLRTSTGEKTSDRAPLPLRIGKTLEAGPVPMTIRSLSDTGGSGVHVTLNADASIEQIQSLKFFDGEGREIKAGAIQKFDSAAQAGRGSSTMSFTLPRSVDEVAVEVVYVERVEELKLPVEVQVDAGVAAVGEAATQPAGPRAERPARPVLTPRNRTSRSPSGMAAAPPRAPATRPTGAAWPATNPSPRTLAPWPVARDAAATLPMLTARAPVPFPATRPAMVRRQPGGVAPATQPVLEGASVRAVSLAVNKPVGNEGLKNWTVRPELTFGQQGGTLVRLLVSLPEQGDRRVLGIDSREVRIERYADDTGAELSTDSGLASRNYAYNPNVAAGAMFSRDAREFLLPVEMKDAPSAGATRFLLAGSVPARVGVNEQTAEQKDFSVAVGSVLRAGPHALTIKSIEASIPPPSVNADVAPVPLSSRVTVTFASPQPVEAIRKVQFFTADGQEVQAILTRPSAAYDPNFAPRTYDCTCHLSRDVDRATVRVTYYERVERVKVPIEIVTGVGL